jgi:hypothetical protein
MTTTFSSLLDDCDLSLSNTRDGSGPTWTATQLARWAIEGMLSFPILRPMEITFTFIASSYDIDLNPDFREMIAVEYPIHQTPMVFLKRMSRHEDAFYQDTTHYDVEPDYDDGIGFKLWLSQALEIGDEITIDYLANHDTTLLDNDSDTVTIEDDHVPIIVAYVVWKAYQERLAEYMQQVSAYSQIITQLVKAVDEAYQRYHTMLAAALAYRSHSLITPSWKVDHHDRVY